MARLAGGGSGLCLWASGEESNGEEGNDIEPTIYP